MVAAGKPDMVVIDGGGLVFEITICARVSCSPAHANAGSVIVCFGGGCWHISITSFQAFFEAICVNSGKIVARKVRATLDVVATSGSACVYGSVKIRTWVGCWITRGTRHLHSIQSNQGNGYDDEIYDMHFGVSIDSENRLIDLKICP